ncbi:unnamed protein product [Mytilus coruscus]|uniref:Integrase zinc-binding domain-containing protein n=1 Tax=Mytilus coruscus TaxID=42192 RepID=A0A6J8B605_MYTCO|nr:unnamed protein product [Mytilus coruscus]
MMAIRMSPNTESIGFSPYHMVFGKEMNIPFDISVLLKENLAKSAKQHLQELIDHLKVVKKISTQNVEVAQEKSKQNYDKKAKEPDFRVGNRVLLQGMKVPKGLSSKLQAKWVGPFYITDVGKNKTYKLRRASNHKIVKSRIHANRIKHYEDPRDHREIVNDENEQNPEDTENNDNIIPNDTQNDLINDNKNEVSDNEHDENSNNDPEFLAEKLTAKKRRNGKMCIK